MGRIDSSGFTLIEIALALVVVVMIIGAVLVPLATQIEQRKITDSQKLLEEAKEALLGFAVRTGHLPCPDKTTGALGGPPTDNPFDGLEDVSAGGTCIAANNEGNLPWATLGLTNADPWGNRIRYRVAGAFAQRPPAALFALPTTSNLEVCTAAACATRLTVAADGPPAVLIVHGRNGYLAINGITSAVNACPAGGCGADELENADGDIRFVSRERTDLGSVIGEFDDIVVWLSPAVLKSRMVAAGRLP